jgi:enoyl-CoA hydratase/carnithine racemase
MHRRRGEIDLRLDKIVRAGVPANEHDKQHEHVPHDDSTLIVGRSNLAPFLSHCQRSRRFLIAGDQASRHGLFPHRQTFSAAPPEPRGTDTMPAVTVEDRGAISIIRINRPERLNAINQAVAVEMQQAFQSFDADPDKRVAILSSAGTRAFTSGADVNDLPELWRAIPNVGFQTEKPIIAATTGWVVGGGVVVVMMCDLMVSTEDTQFYYPEAKLGVTAGGISSLAARMPHKLAMEIMLLGSKIPARRAYEVGFVNRVVPNGDHETEALAMAQQLAESAPLVLAALKRLVNEIMPTGPIERMVAVSQTIARVRQSDDLQEGIRAYKEKRKPHFTGR